MSEYLPSNVPSTTAVPEKCGAGFWTRAFGMYTGNAIASLCYPTSYATALAFPPAELGLE